MACGRRPAWGRAAASRRRSESAGWRAAPAPPRGAHRAPAGSETWRRQTKSARAHRQWLLCCRPPGPVPARRAKPSKYRRCVDHRVIPCDFHNVPESDGFAHVAHEAVAAASQYLREAVRVEKRIEYKSAIDLVTDTDRRVEALVVEHLHRAFPDHLIVGEESSA